MVQSLLDVTFSLNIDRFGHKPVFMWLATKKSLLMGGFLRFKMGLYKKN